MSETVQAKTGPHHLPNGSRLHGHCRVTCLLEQPPAQRPSSSPPSRRSSPKPSQNLPNGPCLFSPSRSQARWARTACSKRWCLRGCLASHRTDRGRRERWRRWGVQRWWWRNCATGSRPGPMPWCEAWWRARGGGGLHRRRDANITNRPDHHLHRMLAGCPEEPHVVPHATFEPPDPLLCTRLCSVPKKFRITG